MKKVLGLVRQVVNNKYTLLALRLILGTIFILAAVGKIPESAKFVDVVTGYGLLPWDLARAYGIILPWLELTIGICLVLGLLTRLAAGVTILMIISFIIANGTAIYSYGYYADLCGCFGSGSPFGLMKVSDALTMDIVMIVTAFIILLCSGGYWSLDKLIRSRLKKPPLQNRQVYDRLPGKEVRAKSEG
jgi:uncharacterized membrane protein YphA (DoxX/SURF4 family)